MLGLWKQVRQWPMALQVKKPKFEVTRWKGTDVMGARLYCKLWWKRLSAESQIDPFSPALPALPFCSLPEIRAAEH